MNGLLLDCRAALRAWTRAPLPVLAALLTLALGTGVNTAVFAVAYSILLRPLPYADPSRLAVLMLVGPDGTEFGVQLPEVDEWRQRLRTVDEAAGYTAGEAIVRGVGDPQIVRVAFVTPGFFDVLGMRAAQGQVSEFRRSPGLSVASAQLARDGNGNARQLLGQSLVVGSVAYPVAAVMPATFAFPTEDVVAWIPVAVSNAVLGIGKGDARSFRIVARLKRGVTVDQARDDVDRVIRETRGADPAKRGGGAARVRLLYDVQVGSVGPVLRALAAGGILVLLVACANVATLLVGRAIGRSRETGMQLALGASPVRLARNALTEAGLLAVAGSALGVAIGYATFRLFAYQAAGVLPRLATASFDARVLGASAVVAVLVTLLCGAAPALRAIATDFGRSFNVREGTSSRRSRRLRAALVVAQLALSIVLLTGAGLLARTVVRLMTEDAGINPRGAIAVKLMMVETPRFGVTERLPFVRTLLERVRALPGVQHAGIGSSLPPSSGQVSLGIRVRTENRDDFKVYNLSAVTPGYLEAIGARTVNGRLFTDRDAQGAEKAIVLSRAAGRHMFPGRDPMGREFPMKVPPGGGPGQKPRVVGIVENVKYGGLDAPAGAAMYVPWTDFPAGVSYLVVRAGGDPAAVAAGVRRAIRELDPAMPIPAIRSLEDEMARAIAERRLRLVPAFAFGALALAVAFIGVFGTVARTVAERRREIAIRGALGATPGSTVRLVAAEGTLLTGLGIVVGLGVAWLAARGLTSLLYGVTPHDPGTLAAVAGVVAVVSLIGCSIPAWRATRVAPLELLHTE